MIKTLSPYYITIPLVSPISSIVCNSYKLSLYVWNGNKTAVPSTASYEKTIYNASASIGNEKINISRLVNDFIDFTFELQSGTGLFDANNQAWVSWNVVYDVDPEDLQLEGIDLAIKGYSYFMEGENASTPTNRILLTGDDFNVNRNGIFILPIKLLEE